MGLGINQTVRESRLQIIIDALDAGASNGYIQFYDGTQPATGGAVTTLLATCDLSDPCGTISNGQLTFNPILDDSSVDATGTITWCRFYDSDGNFIMDADCGNSASSAVVKFNVLNVQAGGVLSITSTVLTEGNI